MNAEIKTRWLAALRDPSARQITANLADGKGGYCANGYLCKVSGLCEELIYQDDHAGKLGAGFSTADGQRWSCLVPPAVREAAGLSREQVGEVMELNDAQAKTLPEIAAWVEENL